MPSITETAKRGQDEAYNSPQRAEESAYDLFRQSQDVLVDVVRTWTESFNRFFPGLSSFSFDPDSLRAGEAIDTAFDFAEQLLASQRQIAHQLVDVTKPLIEVAVKQQRELVSQGERVQREFIEQAERTRQAEREAENGRIEELTVEELREEAAKAGIEGRSSMSKQQLVAALRDAR